MTIKVAVETSDGTIYPIYFGGVRTRTIAAGEMVTSDLIGLQMTAGDFLYLRIFYVGTPAAFYTRQTDLPGGEGLVLIDSVDSGTVTPNGGFALLPTVATGQVDDVADNGVVCIGDSISTGQGAQGWELGFIHSGVSPVHPVTVLGVAGESYQTWRTLRRQRRMAMAIMANAEYAVVSFTNDAYAPRTLGQFQTDLLATTRELSGIGLRVYVCTLTPRTTSTDGWFTLANQTLVANNSTRQSYNDWLRTMADPSIAGVVDVASVVEEGTTGKWKAPDGGVLFSGTITTTQVNYVNDAAANFQSSIQGYTLRNTNTATLAAIAMVVSTIQINTSTGNNYTIGDAYTIYKGLTVDGVHPTPYGHTVMGTYLSAAGLV